MRHAGVSATGSMVCGIAGLANRRSSAMFRPTRRSRHPGVCGTAGRSRAVPDRSRFACFAASFQSVAPSMCLPSANQNTPASRRSAATGALALLSTSENRAGAF